MITLNILITDPLRIPVKGKLRITELEPLNGISSVLTLTDSAIPIDINNCVFRLELLEHSYREYVELCVLNFTSVEGNLTLTLQEAIKLYSKVSTDQDSEEDTDKDHSCQYDGIWNNTYVGD